MKNEFLTIEEVAKILGYTRPTILKMIENKDIKTIDFDGIKIISSSVMEFQKKLQVQKTKALKKLHQIDMELGLEENDIYPQSDNEAYFEEVDID